MTAWSTGINYRSRWMNHIAARRLRLLHGRGSLGPACSTSNSVTKFPILQAKCSSIVRLHKSSVASRYRLLLAPQSRYYMTKRPFMATKDSPDGFRDMNIRLTQVEETLRKLLLDVATFIQQTQGQREAEKGRSGDESATLPNESTVLRFTGGWVRDKLLGADSHDIDVPINNMTDCGSR